MLEYASMRLRLFWSSAVTLPTVIVSIATAESSELHPPFAPPSACRTTRSSAANPAAFAPAAMKPVTDVGAPS